MSNVRASRLFFSASVMAGCLGFAGGCGGETSVPNGGVVAEDPKIYQDREKVMRDAYKQAPPSPFRR